MRIQFGHYNWTPILVYVFFEIIQISTSKFYMRMNKVQSETQNE